MIYRMREAKFAEQTARSAIRSALKSASTIVILLTAWACSGSSDNTPSPVAPTTPNSEVDATPTWMINSSAEQSRFIFDSASNQRVLINVQTVIDETNGGTDYVRVVSEGIPDYQSNISQSVLNQLAGRPDAATDFNSGSTTVALGDDVDFGQDIGYQASAENCIETGGSGYWPPGSGCPQGTEKSVLFTKSPSPNTDVCLTSTGVIGFFSNGTSIYGWNNGQSFQNAGVWQYVSTAVEAPDLDICAGHADGGDYHHHGWSSCLAAQLGENSDRHSPVYGMAADGFLVYGPWFSAGVRAASAWVKRDYDTAGSTTGCGLPGVRNCLLADQTDASKGIIPAVSAGPATNEAVLSASGNSVSATSGLFFQDYYYDAGLTTQGDRFLDQYNGHAHDGSAYHYHLTMTENADGSASQAFPFTFGPGFYGALDNNSLTRCEGAIALDN